MTYRKGWTKGMSRINGRFVGTARFKGAIEISPFTGECGKVNETVAANAHLLANAERLFEALEGLVAACAYVAPIAGAVATEAKVEHIRRAGRFLAAMKKADAALLAADGQGE